MHAITLQGENVLMIEKIFCALEGKKWKPARAIWNLKS